MTNDSTPNVNNITNSPEGFERYKFTRERMRDEVMYRREQQWKVFSWISSLLLAIIGGVIALTGNNLVLALSHKLLLSASVLAFALFGSLRLRHDGSVSSFYSRSYHELDKIFSLEFSDKEAKKWHLGHIGFLLLLTTIAIGVIWIPIVQ
jgi:hypothetical protein